MVGFRLNSWFFITVENAFGLSQEREATTAVIAARSANNGVRSLNWTPGLGKSATSRVSDAMRSATGAVPLTLVTGSTPIGPCSSRRPTGSDFC